MDMGNTFTCLTLLRLPFVKLQTVSRPEDSGFEGTKEPGGRPLKL